MSCCALLFFSACGGEVKPPPPEVHAEIIQRMYTVYKLENFEHATDCTVEQALEMIVEKDAIILDVRSEKERAVSMIPGAVDKEGLLAMGKTKRPVILYCTIGYRSGQACFSLESKGYVAYNLQGGILSWINKKQKIIHDGQPVKKVHVFGKRWNLVPAGYEAVW